MSGIAGETAAGLRRWSWLALVAATLGLDQVTKLAVLAWLSPYEPLAVIPGLNLTLVFNTGAAFSFLSGAGGWQRWLFLALALLVSVVIAIWLWRLEPGQKVLAAGLSLVMAGAIGNAIDRVVYGHVVDFIDVYYQQLHWPAFNIADSAIVVGTGLILLSSLKGEGS